ncbi:MAG: iron-containing alcohol dehydrogenase [Nanoarchaeota archaeon]|nr:iron-containing alcohol dehydrogenase [Nanoarchaeota archaeon]
MTYSINAPGTIIFGSGCFDDLKTHLDKYSPKKILVVTGKHSMQEHGYLDRLKKQLGDYSFVLFSEVTPNPSTNSIDKGTAVALKEGIDLIIGLGGGSVYSINSWS